MGSKSYLASIGYDPSILDGLELSSNEYRSIKGLSELFPLDKFRIIISHGHSHIKKTIILSYFILERLKDSFARPVLKAIKNEEKLKEEIKERDIKYRKIATITIDIKKENSIVEILSRIKNMLNY